jgi:hypothetical protein
MTKYTRRTIMQANQARTVRKYALFFFTVAIATALGTSGASAHHGPNINLAIGVPAPYIGPAPVYIQPPVVYAAPPVFVGGPAPVVYYDNYGRPYYMRHGHRYYHRHAGYRHHYQHHYHGHR